MVYQQRKSHSVSQIPPADIGRTPEIQPMFIITVGDPQKVGDPVRAFITYTVHTRVCRILTFMIQPLSTAHIFFPRRLRRYIVHLLSQFCDAIQTFFGYTRPFPSIILASSFLLFQKNSSMVDFRIHSWKIDAQHSINAFRRLRTILHCEMTRI